MPRDHIIPRFILKGFAINPTSKADNQKIMIYDKATSTVKTEKIADAYAIKDFNSPETEKFLAYEYENGVAKIFQRIKKKAINGDKSVSLSNDEYRLLFRFFVIMWRRNNIQIDKAKELSIEIENTLKKMFGDNYKNMLRPEYKDVKIEDIFESKKDEISKIIYDKVIPETDDNDPTVQKTIKHYIPTIIYNKSKIHFILHNSYGTLIHFVPKGYKPDELDMPSFMIEPISNEFCFYLLFSYKEIDISKVNFEIPIEICDNDTDIKNRFINGYITPVATSFVVDETNKEFVIKLHNNGDNDVHL